MRDLDDGSLGLTAPAASRHDGGDDSGTGGPSDAARAVRVRWALRLGFYGALVSTVALMLQDFPKEVVGVFGLVVMIVLLLMRTPVAIAMIVAGALGIHVLGGARVLASTFRTLPFHSVAGWSFSVVPMFILMGLLLWRCGASERLYEATRHWLGWLPGGLAVGTNFAGAGLASVSGSTLGVTYALARIGVPEMMKAGYDRRYATASILMAGTGGQLIPPSILLVVYAGIATVPVGPQLLAGLLPGVVLALAYGVLLVGIGIAAPGLAGRATKAAEAEPTPQTSTWGDRWRSLGVTWPMPALAATILLGLYGGVFTATEAGAFGAVGALMIAWRYGGWRSLGETLGLALTDTVRATGAIFLLIVGAGILSRFLALSGLASWTVTTVSGLGLTRVQFLLALMVAYLLLGMFLDPLTMMLITVPILLPVLQALEINVLWFGVFIVLLGELAVVTPPVGVLTFVVHRLVQDPHVNLGTRVSLGDVFAGVLWFLPVSVGVLLLLILVPELTEIVPGLAGYTP